VLHLRDELGLTIVLIEHDMSVVRATAQQVYVLSAGHDIAHGVPSTVLDEPEVKRVYLGDFEIANA
jgi:branched-chain amino acid transport system ATP-binding protein